VTVAELSLRRLLSADAALYREIRLEALKQNPEAFGSTYETESTQPLTWFAERLDSSAVFGAFDSSGLVGIAGFYIQQGRKQTHKGALWGMYVRQSVREAGVGRRLVEAVIEHARRRVELIQLSVVSGNEHAQQLYASLGFVEYGVERNALKHDGRYWDEVLMAKSLLSDQTGGS
jgi:RimJ/RimL family protein N-acetyltransferase